MEASCKTAAASPAARFDRAGRRAFRGGCRVRDRRRGRHQRRRRTRAPALARRLGRPPAVILNGSHRFADGTLHDAAAAAGASVTHLDWQWNYAAGIRHWRPRKPGHGLSLMPPKSALWLNSRGERIGPAPLVSGFDTHDLVARICPEPGGYSWQLLNRRIALKELAVSGTEFNPAIRERRRLRFALDLLFGNRWLYDELTRNSEDIVVADTLPELVERMNALNGDDVVDLASVERAVDAYDSEIDRGERFHNDEQLRRIAWVRRWPADRLRTCAFQQIRDRGAGPLVAIREYIISRKSMGGIETDLECRAPGRRSCDLRTLRCGRSRGIRRRRHERQARPRGNLPRRLHPVRAASPGKRLATRCVTRTQSTSSDLRTIAKRQLPRFVFTTSTAAPRTSSRCAATARRFSGAVPREDTGRCLETQALDPPARRAGGAAVRGGADSPQRAFLARRRPGGRTAASAAGVPFTMSTVSRACSRTLPAKRRDGCGCRPTYSRSGDHGRSCARA